MSLADRADPRAGFRLRVELGRSIAGWFTEVAGLSVERAVEPLNEGGVNDHQHWLPGPVKRSSVTLRHGVAGEELWQWFVQGLYDDRVEPRDVAVCLLSADGSVFRTWELPAAIPLRWGGITLQSDGQSAFVEELELGQGGAGVSAIQRATADGSGAPRVQDAGDAPIDLALLARKVFELLKEDLRIEQQRRRAPWG